MGLAFTLILLKAGRTSLRLKAKAIAREQRGIPLGVVAEGLTFVALDSWEDRERSRKDMRAMARTI